MRVTEISVATTFAAAVIALAPVAAVTAPIAIVPAKVDARAIGTRPGHPALPTGRGGGGPSKHGGGADSRSESGARVASGAPMPRQNRALRDTPSFLSSVALPGSGAHRLPRIGRPLTALPLLGAWLVLAGLLGGPRRSGLRRV